MTYLPLAFAEVTETLRFHAVEQSFVVRLVYCVMLSMHGGIMRSRLAYNGAGDAVGF
jgi:hypothetical protein